MKDARQTQTRRKLGMKEDRETNHLWNSECQIDILSVCGEVYVPWALMSVFVFHVHEKHIRSTTTTKKISACR